MRSPIVISTMLGGDTLLRRLLLLYVAAIVAIVLGGAAVISLAVWPHYEGLERSESANRMQAVLQAIHSEQDRLQDLVNTNAIWDDAFQFVLGRNPKFPVVNFEPDALDQIGVDAVIITRNDGVTLYRGGRGDFQALMEAAERANATAPGLLFDAEDDHRTALITVGRDVALLAKRRIVRIDGSGPSPGVLLFARRVGPDVLSRMRTLTGADFRITVTSARAPIASASRAQTVLSDAYGHATTHVALMGAREILTIGKATIVTMSAAAALMLGVLGAAFAAALINAAVSPVKSLQRSVMVASETQSPCQPAPGAPSEIKDLAAAFGNALQLAMSQTELRNAALAEKQAAESANAAKSTFIANISHELRTPLNAVIGYGELIHETATEEGRAQDAHDAVRIVRAAQGLLVLINNILDFSKLGAGKMAPLAQTFDVKSMLELVVDIGLPLATTKGLSLTLIVEDGLGQMHSDQQKLKQCLINLISNAVKFTEHGGVTLRAIRATEDGVENVQFEVSDTGIGMEASALQRIFEPFSQADNTISTRFGGTGLGLAITHDLVKLLGARISVKSEPGAGTVFVILAPATLIPEHVPHAATRDAA
jgi:signal transduction histidine kinase